MNYINLLFLSATDVIVSIIAVLTIAVLYGIYWSIKRRYNTGLQQFYIDTLVNEHDQAIALIGEDEKILLSNKIFEELIGVSSGKLIGNKLSQLSLKPDMLKALTKSDEKIRIDGATHVSYNYKIRRFKSFIWLNVQKRVINEEKTGKKHMLLLVTDISEKKKVEERLFNTQIEYQQLVESANDIIYRTDIAGNILYSNSAITKILGYENDFLRKINIKSIVHEADLNRLISFFTEKLNEVNGEDYIEFRAIAMDGSLCWLGQKTSLITAGDETIGLQSVARDITSRIEAEQELLRAKEIAENASEAKSNFISSLSHEFRTPLNAILGYSQILERNSAILPDEKGHVSEIKNAGEKLLSMVDDILELSNLEARHTQKQTDRMMLRPFMDNYAHRFSEVAKSKQLEFNYSPEVDAPEYLITDFNRLSLVIKNILDNAIKFTESGTIDLSYSVESKNLDHFLKISVSDSGEGINESKLKEAFQPFWQADPLKSSGTGLGLTLSERIAHFLGGEITLRNKPESGLNVDIIIPVDIVKSTIQQKITLNEDSEHEVVIQRTGETKILIVDDLLPNRTITRIILKENGYDYEEAEDGLEALTKIEEFDPDVILMDINMPIMDGIEAMLKIRARDWKFKNMPIIAVTAGAKGGRNELIEQGFSDYLQKPFKEADLIELIELQIEENISKFFEEDDSKSDELTSGDVAEYLHRLDVNSRRSILNIIENQFLEKLNEDYFLDRNPSIVFSSYMQRIFEAAETYDFPFLSSVVNHVNTFADSKSE